MSHHAVPVTGSDAPRPMLGAAQRVVESAVIALATSTGLYLVGSVYTDAYFARLSIDVSSLDLASPFVALQSTHVLESLLEIPTMLLVLYLIYRLLSSRVSRFRSWYDRSRQRLGRLFLLVVNMLTVFPLLLATLQAAINAGSARTARSSATSQRSWGRSASSS
jgi:hypothetical protein